MPECPIEQAQTRILVAIAEEGKESTVNLSAAFREDEITRAAMRGLVFEKVGAFARSVMLESMGNAGSPEDVEKVLMHLLGHEKVSGRKKYANGLCNFGDTVFPYRADKDEWVRTSALAAVEKILMREEGAKITPETERVLVKCMFMDPSENAGKAAARVLSANSSMEGFNFFFILLGNAEKMKNAAAMQRGEKALAGIIESMKKNRVRGSFLIPLIKLCEGSEKMWRIAEDAIVELFESSDMKKEIQNRVFKEKLRRINLDRENDDANIPLQRIERAINRIGEDHTSRIKGRKKKMTAEGELNPKELMRPPAKMKMRAEMEETPMISRGPVVDKILGVGRAIKRIVKGPRK